MGKLATALMLMGSAALGGCAVETGEDLGRSGAPLTVNNGGVDLQPILGVQPARIESLELSDVPQMIGGDPVDMAAAVALGKAFFWDIQVGGDNQTACASCHFNAGVDDRVVNTINPGPDAVFQLANGPGAEWNGSFDDPVGVDDIIGSQGVSSATFRNISTTGADDCSSDPHAIFGNHRQVTGRQTPSMIGAIFNKDNFWDGRADDTFNGVDPFGPDGSGRLSIGNASMASQAVGPPNNEVEMSCFGRPFDGRNSLAERLIERQPLALQDVAPDDSALAAWRDSDGTGLVGTYRDLIRAAFGNALADRATNRGNFSRIWGQAVQHYVATLVPNQAPIDDYLAGNNDALDDLEEDGFRVFIGEGRNLANLCANCHHGALFSDATVAFADSGEGNFDDADVGFHNLGVTPTAADPGRAPFAENGHARNEGAFKTPSLRNIALTAPYFHDGSATSLREAILLYDRGGNFANAEKSRAIPGHADSPGQLAFEEEDLVALEAFLRNALTDCRVPEEAGPFDHPSIPLPNGSSLSATGASGNGTDCGGL